MWKIRTRLSVLLAKKTPSNDFSNFCCMKDILWNLAFPMHGSFGRSFAVPRSTDRHPRGERFKRHVNSKAVCVYANEQALFIGTHASGDQITQQHFYLIIEMKRIERDRGPRKEASSSHSFILPHLPFWASTNVQYRNQHASHSLNYPANPIP